MVKQIEAPKAGVDLEFKGFSEEQIWYICFLAYGLSRQRARRILGRHLPVESNWLTDPNFRQIVEDIENNKGKARGEILSYWEEQNQLLALYGLRKYAFKAINELEKNGDGERDEVLVRMGKEVLIELSRRGGKREERERERGERESRNIDRLILERHRE